MTTIAYDGKYIVSDGRECIGNLIVSNSRDKIFKKDDGLFFALAGPVDEIEIFINEFSANKEFSFGDSDVSGFMVQDGFVYYVGVSDKKFFKCKQGFEKFAVGSGRDFAITAMDYGSDALTAIKYASERCCKTGGSSFILDVKSGAMSVVEKDND